MYAGWYVAIPFVVALCAVIWIYSRCLYIAKLKNIVDKPDARKLQDRPVPIMGGIAVFFGIIVSMVVAGLFVERAPLTIVVLGMVVMLYIGTIDDIIGLSPRLRFFFEIAVTLALIYVGGFRLSSLEGLWGVRELPDWFSLLLTIVASVGIINAVNLIDGVDGLASGSCIVASTIFGAMFLVAGDYSFAALAAASAGALIPFFLHNVFGRETKMFIGDGGTLLMGFVMSVFVMRILQEDFWFDRTEYGNMGMVAFVLAILAVPVFDTLRVMSVRIARGGSPFRPDKTHLHHILIDLGFSHLKVTFAVLLMNVTVVLTWWLMYELGASIELQTYVVVALGLFWTFGLYGLLAGLRRRYPAAYEYLRSRFGRRTIEDTKSFATIRTFVDRHNY